MAGGLRVFPPFSPMTKNKRYNPDKPKAMTARQKNMARQLTTENGRMPSRRELIRRPKPEEAE